MIEKTPKVTTLAYIAPSPESTRADVLEYTKIDEVVESHRPFEYARLRDTFDARTDSLEEKEAARQQAFQYLLFTVVSLKNAVTPEAREMWSNRYTQATTELYGVPDAEAAKNLFMQQQKGETMQPFTEVAQQVGEYLDAKYADVYDALDLENVPSKIPIEEVANSFEEALSVLAQQDAAWEEWTVERDADAAQISVAAKSKKIIVGMRAIPVSKSSLKGLFSHEVLVHALRAVNDQKVGDKFEAGLPGYLDADEGLGVFVEYATTGVVPTKIIDRYVDIAYALGLIDDKQHTRQELLNLAMARAINRNELAEEPKSLEDITKSVYNHVNRIYRGSRGDKHIGIYTKDIAYYIGFMKVGEFITEQFEAGKSIRDIMEYLLSGRFDPTNNEHREHMNSRLVK